MLPPHAQFKGVDMLGKRGEFNASGEIDIGKETGSIQAQWQQFLCCKEKIAGWWYQGRPVSMNRKTSGV
jgi:hypothetical protein